MVMTVEFELDGQRFVGINGGPQFTFDEAISFQINCDDQEEVDYYWERLTEGGEESQCGWLKDRFGLSWQVVPTGMEEVFADPDPERAQARDGGDAKHAQARHRGAARGGRRRERMRLVGRQPAARGGEARVRHSKQLRHATTDRARIGADRPVDPDRLDAAAARVECCRQELALVAVEKQQALAFGEVPEPRRTRSGGDDPAAVGTEGDAADDRKLTGQVGHRSRVAEVPDVDVRVLARSREQPTGAVEGDAEHRGAGVMGLPPQERRAAGAAPDRQ